VIKRAVNFTYRMGRRIAVAVVGTTIVLIGVIMLVTPGPAIVVIPVGLAILSLEFAWARTWLAKLRATISYRNAKNHGTRVERHRDRVSDEP